MRTEDEVVDVNNGISDEDEDEDYDHSKMDHSSIIKEAKEQVKQLERLKDKDPEFYQFLLENDKGLLEFSDDDLGEGDEIGVDDDYDDRRESSGKEEEKKSSKGTITLDMVDSWCKEAKENGKIGAVRSLLKAYRIACHHGDDTSVDSSSNLHIMSSNIFNKVMSFVLSEMDGVFKSVMQLPPSGGNKENIMELKNTKRWKKYGDLVKSYLGNSLHVLNQMTNSQMISFTLRRLRFSSLFLAAFPSLLRKYIKVVLHFWCTGGGALPVAALLFLRDLCIRLGSECMDECVKGIYKAYVMNCHFVNAYQLQHVHFLANCVIELLGVNLQTSYVHAFAFIRQLAMILREALNTKPKVGAGKEKKKANIGPGKEKRENKKAYSKIYAWKFINCLELWTGAICAYGSEADFRPLAYPLAQIIYGAARLVPSAKYFPLRLRCVKMLNRIAAATNTFIPVSMLLLDMLEMKELHMPPKGGIGDAVDLRSMLRVKKPTLMTRSFQEACVTTVVEDLTEHLAQWSYSPAFFELSFLPLVRLRSFCKSTKIERFRREIKQLVYQIEANSEFINQKRKSITFLPNEPAVTSFLEEEKKSCTSPLSTYAVTLHSRAQQRTKSLKESSVLVGSEGAVFIKRKVWESDDDDDDDNIHEGAATVFSSTWLPTGKDTGAKQPLGEEGRKRKRLEGKRQGAVNEDIVEDLVLSSDEESDEDEDEDEGGLLGDKEPRKDAKGKGSAKKNQKKRNQQVSNASSGKKKKGQRNGKKRKRGQ